MEFVREGFCPHIYVDELITHLRHSSYGLHIGQLFVGCAFYADDIALLSASCNGYKDLLTFVRNMALSGTYDLILLKAN